MRSFETRSSGFHNTIGRRGFTLVEILVVLAIISVLAGLATVSVQQARIFADARNARLEIQQLEAAALSYKNAFGDFPPTSLGRAGLVKGLKTNGINDGIESLVLHIGTRKRGGPFFDDISEDRLENHDDDQLSAKQQAAIKSALDLTWNTTSLLEYTDRWGNPFVYVHHRDYGVKTMSSRGFDGDVVRIVPGKSEKTGTYHKPTTLQIWSFGPNGENENGDGDDITSWGY